MKVDMGFDVDLIVKIVDDDGNEEWTDPIPAINDTVVFEKVENYERRLHRFKVIDREYTYREGLRGYGSGTENDDFVIILKLKRIEE